MPIKFDSSETKLFKLNVRNFCELIPTFAEVTGVKLVGGGGGWGRELGGGGNFLLPPLSWIGLMSSLLNSAYNWIR